MRRYHLFGRFWRADWPRFRKLWRLGVPIGLTLAFEVTIFNAARSSWASSARTSWPPTRSPSRSPPSRFMVPFGFAQAVTVRVGRAFGARDPEGVTRAGWTAFALGVGFMGLTAMLMFLAPRQLVAIFLDLGDPEECAVIGFALSFLVLAAIFQLADGAQVVGAGMLRGLQDTKVPMIFAGIGYWGVGLPLGVALAFGTPLRGSASGSASPPALGSSPPLMLWRWTSRSASGSFARSGTAAADNRPPLPRAGFGGRG